MTFRRVLHRLGLGSAAETARPFSPSASCGAYRLLPRAWSSTAFTGTHGFQRLPVISTEILLLLWFCHGRRPKGRADAGAGLAHHSNPLARS